MTWVELELGVYGKIADPNPTRVQNLANLQQEIVALNVIMADTQIDNQDVINASYDVANGSSFFDHVDGKRKTISTIRQALQIILDRKTALEADITGG